MATPTRVRALVGAFRSAHPETGLNLHFHNTRGTGLANVLAALELGVADFDASVGGLGGCPYAPGATGNIATEELVHMVEDMGVVTGIDLDAMIAARGRGGGHRRPHPALPGAPGRPPHQDNCSLTSSAAMKDRDSSRDLWSRCRFAVQRPGIPEASPRSHGMPCRGSVLGDADARLVLADSLKVSLRTDILGEGEAAFPPDLRPGY